MAPEELEAASHMQLCALRDPQALRTQPSLVNFDPEIPTALSRVTESGATAAQLNDMHHGSPHARRSARSRPKSRQSRQKRDYLPC